MLLAGAGCRALLDALVCLSATLAAAEALSSSVRRSAAPSPPGTAAEGSGETLVPLPQAASFFGGRRPCKSSFVRESFSAQALLDAEAALEEWAMHLDAGIEAYNNGRSSKYSLRQLQDDTPSRQRFAVAFPPQGPNCTSPLQWFGDPGVPDELKPVCDAGGSLMREGADCDIVSIGSRNLWSTEADKKQRQFVTWPELLQTAGIAGAPEYVKMDIEGFEFETMRSMLHGDPSLLPSQLAMEVHHETTGPSGRQPQSQLSWSFRGKDTGELLAFAMMLYTAGYRLSYVNPRTVCTHCLEVLLTKVYC